MENKTYMIKKGLRNPIKALNYLKNRFYRYYKLWGHTEYRTSYYNTQEVEKFSEELQQNLDTAFSELEGELRGHSIVTGKLGEGNAKALYNFIREAKPEVVVETGVCNGYSTAHILKALEDNGSGELYSIDLPEKPGDPNPEISDVKGGAVIPPNKESGWLVPNNLENRWTFIEGNSNYELPKLIEKLDNVDIFLHDSDHSYQTMMLEYCVAWTKLSEKGAIISDDILWNTAFSDFCDGKDTEKYILGDGLGLTFKQL